MPPFDSGDDFVWVLGPDKGFWVCIGVVEEAVDGIFELPQGSENAALETLLCKLGKETLDGVEPGSGCRGEVLSTMMWIVFFLDTLASMTFRNRMNS